jgi:hypothetical protein
MDISGHYFRRIKSVAVSIPCVTGPMVGVHCKVTLLRSSIRTNAQLLNGEEYRRNSEGDDPRFDDYYGTTQSIVTSTAQNDTGMFETNYNDERYLPFEGAGVISTWRLELPDSIRQFDYETISDVMLHFSYTAREGGEALADKAIDHVLDRARKGVLAGTTRLFSARHEFGTGWARFKANKDSPAELALDLTNRHYPYWTQVPDAELDSISRIEFITPKESTVTDITIHLNPDAPDDKETVGLDDVSGLKRGYVRFDSGSRPKAIGNLLLTLDSTDIEDLFILITLMKDS